MTNDIDDTFVVVSKQEQNSALISALGLGLLIGAFCSSRDTSSVDSVFKCIVPVPITITDYSNRIGTFTNCDSSSFVIASIFAERVFKKHPEYFCPLSAHKLMCSLILISIKFNEDIYYSNSYCSEVFGVDIEELNQMETELINLLNYELFVNFEEFEKKKLILNSLVKSNEVKNNAIQIIEVDQNKPKENQQQEQGQEQEQRQEQQEQQQQQQDERDHDDDENKIIGLSNQKRYISHSSRIAELFSKLVQNILLSELFYLE